MKQETTDKKGCLRIALFCLTFIEVFFVYAFFIVDWWPVFLLGGLYLILCGVAILCMIKTYRLRNKMEKVLFFWSLTALSVLPIGYGINKAKLYYFPPSVTFYLPDDEILKVTMEKLEWGKEYTVPTNYINLGKFNMDYSLAITKEDSLFVWPLELSDAVHCNKYAVGHLPKGKEGKKAFDKATSHDRLKWKYEYTFIIDGIHTGGTQTLYIPKPDSIDVHSRNILNWQRIDKCDIIKDYRQPY